MAKKRVKRHSKAAENAKRRAQEHQAGFAPTTFKLPPGAELFKPKTSRPMRVDILNYKVGKGNPWADEGEEHYERTYWVHRAIGPDNNSYVCPAKTAGKRCPVCEEHIKALNKHGYNSEEEKALRPQERQLFNVIDLEEPQKGVQIWDISNWCFGRLLDAEIREADPDDHYECFANHQGGMTLKLGVEEKSMGGAFTFPKVERIAFKPRKTDYGPEIENQLYCLDDLLIILEYKKLKEIFLQTLSDDEHENEKEDVEVGDEEKDDDVEEEEDDSNDFDDDDDDVEEEEEEEDDDDDVEEEEEDDDDVEEEEDDFDDDDEEVDEDEDVFAEDEEPDSEDEDFDDEDEFDDDDFEDDEPKVKSKAKIEAKGKKGRHR